MISVPSSSSSCVRVAIVLSAAASQAVFVVFAVVVFRGAALATVLVRSRRGRRLAAPTALRLAPPQCQDGFGFLLLDIVLVVVVIVTVTDVIVIVIMIVVFIVIVVIVVIVVLLARSGESSHTLQYIPNIFGKARKIQYLINVRMRKNWIFRCSKKPIL